MMQDLYCTADAGETRSARYMRGTLGSCGEPVETELARRIDNDS
jgi:hypothetical protein